MAKAIVSGADISEYEGNRIPAYDPTIPDKARERLMRLADIKLKETINRVLKESE